MTLISENSSYALARFTYDALGRRTALARGPSGSLAGTGYGYDGRGNLNSDGTRAFTYDLDNHLLTASAPTPVSLTYDPLGRLRTSAASGATTNFLYDGGMLIAEYNSSGTILNRYAPGPGVDEPLVWYAGTGTTGRRWLHADDAGSIIAWSDTSGAAQAAYGYDPFGQPGGAWSGSRYSYTGQLMIPEAHLYNYKARVYDPGLGRFLQTDPAGYASDINAYAYAHNDAVNRWDPSGMDDTSFDGGGDSGDVEGGDPDPGPPYSTPFVGVVDLTGVTVTGRGCTSGAVCIPGSSLINIFTVPQFSPAAPPGNFGTLVGEEVVTAKPKRQNTQPSNPCASPNPNFQCNSQGQLEPTPDYQEQICANFHALQDGATKTNDGFFVVGLFGGKGGALFSVFGTLVSSFSTGLGFRPFWITIVPPIQPPPGY